MKPWLVLNQLERKFELILIDVLKGEQKAPAFLAMNPLGVVPYLETETGHGIGESNAMLWYLAEGTHLMPPTPEDRAEALQWMFFEQSKLEPFISPARFFSYILPDQRDANADMIEDWQEKAKDGLARLNGHLETTQFMLSSGYSIADIAVFGYVHVLEQAGLSGDDYPAVIRWIEDVTQTEKFVPLAQLGHAVDKAA